MKISHVKGKHMSALRNDMGNPGVQPGLPVPVPTKTCTRAQGYGFSRVRVKGCRGYEGKKFSRVVGGRVTHKNRVVILLLQKKSPKTT